MKTPLFQSITMVAGAMLCSMTALAQTGAPVAQAQKPPVSLSPALPTTTNPPADPAKMAEPAGGTAPASVPVAPDFVLGAEDQITVSMWDEGRLNGSFTIRPDGKFSMPLLGEIQAAGLTPKQLEEAINKAALSMMQVPRASVNVVGVHSRKVYFDGEGIGQNGTLDLVMPMHLLEGISAKGGFKDFANKNKIRILRDGKPLMIKSGNKTTQYIRYKDMIDGKHPESNPELRDKDHVIIN